MEIQGCVALVTGASSGLGAATAARLTRLGAVVLAFDREPARLAGVESFQGDLTDSSAVEAAVERATRLGPLRIVVNCAGGAPAPARTVDRLGEPYSLDRWRAVVDLNLVAAYDVTRLAAAAMANQTPDLDSGRGVIVHTSSIAGLDGSLAMSSYVASKSALASLAHSTARDLAVWGIRVVAVAPGAFETPAYQGLPEELRQRREREFVYPRRAGRPEEFAFFVQHLVENDYLNAECFRIDAGLRLHE